MKEPEVPDFDYDAHIAELMARSENKTVKSAVNPRGWENDQALLTRGVLKKKHNNEFGDDDDNWSEADDDEEGEEEDNDEECDRLNQTKGVRTQFDSKADEEFERFLDDEYDDEKIGYIDDVEEDDIQGIIELDGNNEIFNQAIEDFIQV